MFKKNFLKLTSTVLLCTNFFASCMNNIEQVNMQEVMNTSSLPTEHSEFDLGGVGKNTYVDNNKEEEAKESGFFKRYWSSLFSQKTNLEETSNSSEGSAKKIKTGSWVKKGIAIGGTAFLVGVASGIGGVLIYKNNSSGYNGGNINSDTVPTQVSSTVNTCPAQLSACINNLQIATGALTNCTAGAANNRTALSSCTNSYTNLLNNYNGLIVQNSTCASSLITITTERDNCRSDYNTLNGLYNSIGGPNAASAYNICNSSLTTCNSDKANLQSSLSSCNTNYSTANQNYIDCNANLLSNISALNTANNNYNSCNTEKIACLSDLSSQNNNASNYFGNYTLCMTDLSNCNNDKNTCNTNLNSTTNSLNNCTSAYSSANSTIANLTTTLSDCNTTKNAYFSEIVLTEALNARLQERITKLGPADYDDLKNCEFALYGDPLTNTTGCSGQLNGYTDDNNVTYPGCLETKTNLLLENSELAYNLSVALTGNQDYADQVDSLNSIIAQKDAIIDDLTDIKMATRQTLNGPNEQDHFSNLQAQVTLPNSTVVLLTRYNFYNYYKTTYPVTLSVEQGSNQDLISLDPVAVSLNPTGPLTVNLQYTNNSICNSVPSIDLSGFSKVSKPFKISGRLQVPLLGPANMDNYTLSTTSITNSIYDLKNGYFDLSDLKPCLGNSSYIKSNDSPQITLSDSSGANNLLVSQLDGNYDMQLADFQNCYPELLSGTNFLSSGTLPDSTAYGAGQYLKIDGYKSNSIIYDLAAKMSNLTMLRTYAVDVTSAKLNSALTYLGDPGDIFCGHYSIFMGTKINIPANTILGCGKLLCSTPSNNATCTPNWIQPNFLTGSVLIDSSFYITPTSLSDTKALRIPYGIGDGVLGSNWAKFAGDLSVAYWANGTSWGAPYTLNGTASAFGYPFELYSQTCLA